MNITTYTEFKDIKIGEKFICSGNFVYTKIADDAARHEDKRYTNGFLDYKLDADDRYRVQP